MSFLSKNREILLVQYPGLFEELSAKSDDGLSPEDIKIDTSPTGDPALSIRSIHIHSPRDPAREGQRLAEAVNVPGSKGAVVILGFGLGYAAEAAAAFGKPVIIVEKYKSIILKALELRDFGGFLSQNKIIFVIGGSGDGIVNALAIVNEILSANSGGQDDKKAPPLIIRNKALMNLDEQWYRSVEDKIRTWSVRDDVNIATHKRFGRRWVRNLARNMSAIRDCPGVSHLADLTAEDSLPVFLAAAGPSLDKIKPMLRDIYDRCVVVAVDTSLRFFVKNGITPDFVLVIDPQFWNSRHLDRCLNEQTKSRTALIAESAVYPPVLNMPFKYKFLCGSLFPLGTFIEKQVDPKGRLGAGGSVATTAWDFARSLGAKEIWIAGLDLAFPGLKTHFRGARFEEKSNAESNRLSPAEKWIVRALRDGNPFSARSASGGQVLTDQRLSLYAAWFENQFKQNEQINNYGLFTEGLAITGLHAAECEKFLEFPKRREEIDRRIQSALEQTESSFNNAEEKRRRSERYDAAIALLNSGLKNIKNASEEGAEIARAALSARRAPGYSLNAQQQNKTLKKLDEITKRITESEVKEIAGFLMPHDENEAALETQDKNDPFAVYLKSTLKFFHSLAQAASSNLAAFAQTPTEDTEELVTQNAAMENGTWWAKKTVVKK
jgi:hypothetical protein